MKNIFTSILITFMFVISGNAIAVDDIIKKPTAEQVLNFTDALAKSSTTDRKVATQALQKWMDGKLSNKDAASYKDTLKLSDSTSTPITTMGSTEQCAACMAACCAWWGCNPACIAGCVAGICKN